MGLMLAVFVAGFFVGAAVWSTLEVSTISGLRSRISELEAQVRGRRRVD